MPGDSGVTVVTNSRVFYTTREAAGASDARHSLRPLNSEDGKFRQNSRDTRGEIAKLWLFEIGIRVARVERSVTRDLHYMRSPYMRSLSRITLRSIRATKNPWGWAKGALSAMPTIDPLNRPALTKSRPHRNRGDRRCFVGGRAKRG